MFLLSNPAIEFLKEDERGIVTQIVRGHPFTWEYSKLLSELSHQAESTSLERLIPASEVALSGELGSSTYVTSIGVVYPLLVQHVYRGPVAASNLSLAVLTSDPQGKDRPASITQGIVNRNFSERRLRSMLRGRKSELRVLVLGRILPSGEIAPLSYGCLEIDDKGFVRGPAYEIDSGQLARSARSLDDLRRMLK